MQSLLDLIKELEIYENYTKFQDRAVHEIMERFDTKVAEANRNTGSFRRVNIFRDKPLVSKTRKDLSGKLKKLLDVCMLSGYSNDINRVQCIKRDEAVLIESCLNSLYMPKVTPESRIGYESFWVHNPVREDGAVTELSTYIVNTRIELSMWLRKYMQEHPLQCYDKTYTFVDVIDFVDWKEFMDTASNILLRVAIQLQGTCTTTGGYTHLFADSRIERYTVRFLLQYLKDELSIRVFYDDTCIKQELNNMARPSTSPAYITLEEEIVAKYNKYFSNMHFSNNFEENYTKEVLNLSELEILNNKGTLGLEVETFKDRVSYGIVVKGSYVDRNEEVLRQVMNYTNELE